MQKLLIVTTIPATLSSFFLPFASHFRHQGWQVDAMACGISTSPECLQAFNRVWEVEWSRNPLDPRNLLVAPRIIQQVIQQGEYDIVHVHTPVAAFVTRYALKNYRQQKKPQVFYTAHGFHFHPNGKALKNAVFLALEKLAGNWTDYLIVINHDDEEVAKRYKIVPSERVYYMSGIGVDLDYYSCNSVSQVEVEQVRQELGLTPTTQLFLSVGELTPRKHPQDVLKAFALLGRSEVSLAFAGNGPLMAQMQQLASQLEVQNQVHFLGLRRDIPTLIRTAVATVLASEQEGLPRCVMESMSMETPVIGTYIRGTRDLLAGGCGLLVNVGDIKAVAAAMGWILDNPQAARVMAQRAYERIADYELSQIVQQHEVLYAKAIQHKEFASVSR
ncbi:MAG: glycosyltransferase family 4 protein [Scytonema sp. PMC 1069.18]|nr:glycosyltransferase family 4 protein [Scytonema sp. PMC 1069.18]MEC4882918.1 glycosyltransferase family 4 protein [Scytonema sp. PMC 1070.18]